MELDAPVKIQLAHDSQNRFQIDILSCLVLYPAPDTADSIRLLAPPLTLNNQVNQPLVFAFFPLPVSPCIVTAAGYLKHPAHGFDTVLCTKPFDDPIFQLHLLPASDRIFRSSSTCIRNVTSSLLRRISSSSRFFRGRPLGRGTYPPAMRRAFRFCRVINFLICLSVSP